jgi:hypothetical protein
MRPSREFSIDKLRAADSIVTLLARLDVSDLSWEERLAVGACQARAIDDWLEAYSAQEQRPDNAGVAAHVPGVASAA